MSEPMENSSEGGRPVAPEPCQTSQSTGEAEVQCVIDEPGISRATLFRSDRRHLRAGVFR